MVSASAEVFGIEEIAPASDERKKVWSEFIPVIHLAMATRSAVIARGFDVDDPRMPDGLISAELLRIAPPADWVGRLLMDAEEWSYRIYFQGLIPHPERLIHLNARAKDLLL
jgi:hypothetical protein